MSALALEVAINLLLSIGVVGATTSCEGEEMKILPPNFRLPTSLTRFRFRWHPPADPPAATALYRFTLVKHTCPGSTALFIRIIISQWLVVWLVGCWLSLEPGLIIDLIIDLMPACLDTKDVSESQLYCIDVYKTCTRVL
ncbi:hypothetical protein PRUPE_7G069700 [Prunus persica]|uniref:Uncharacterized protein n=1 Tax=Prunus persica TaxID=3760 RepID=A0A251N7X3_PRUPE|nr:hypothetical protein PRUPE_7G069700 [Prunus persica]